VACLVLVLEASGGKEQQNQRQQQEHTPCGRQFFDDSPKQRFGDVPPALAARLSRLPLAQSRGIQPVAGTRIFFQLRPELVHLQPLADALPELFGFLSEVPVRLQGDDILPGNPNSLPAPDRQDGSSFANIFNRPTITG
jgi:hypothetical protein